MTTVSGKLNTEHPLVTVIMPVYKVEEYVGKAIESIQNQTCPDGSGFDGWELIAVDDGSPDRSGEICDRFAKKDPRIRVIHQENAGAPTARNAAIRVAAGKYLFFMDSDDWAEPDMLFEMCWMAEKNAAQLVIAGFYIDTYYKVVMKKHGARSVIDERRSRYLTSDYIPEAGIYESAEAFRKEAHKLFDINMLYQPWNKLYLRSYMEEHGIVFPDTYRDDFPFVLDYIRDVSRVVVTDHQYYHFLRARSESETQKYVPNLYEKREEEHGWMVDIYRQWDLWDRPENKEMVARRYIDRVIECCENLTNPNCALSTEEKRTEVRNILHNPRVSEMLGSARPRKLYLKAMYIPIRLKSTRLTLLEAGKIRWVKKQSLRILTLLKTGRQKQVTSR